MANTTVAQSPATTTRRAPRLVFRPADARRPFRRGDLALHAGSIVVICMSEHDNGDLDAELPVRTTRGVVGSARARSLRLLAGVDTQEFGPGYHDLLKFIADAVAAH
ncbi:hypothetical protein H4CHR_02332 [Variovorax sp. PBS-H4]|uniref:hypothetical protein n=1 Tax=Variovorax sp. PBS-H4 TaxID=434008 RepID=UPI0013199963|nr:hypothetical protein [Variovorax sp. PBS-H4]VTU29078.1 hypothetical protein H4CHR_02332 [Variovorax sp. PBS-H4]